MPAKIKETAAAVAKSIKALCRGCKGAGYTDETKSKFCETCKGSGVESVDASITENCPACKGRGRTGDGHCEDCAATGKVITTVTN